MSTRTELIVLDVGGTLVELRGIPTMRAKRRFSYADFQMTERAARKAYGVRG